MSIYLNTLPVVKEAMLSKQASTQMMQLATRREVVAISLREEKKMILLMNTSLLEEPPTRELRASEFLLLGIGDFFEALQQEWKTLSL
jgi:hypothetical protein